ncbi:SDR family oxidoreductase [Nocardiopsis composta]|uniref:NAD(P)-dependent dehydrogenase (Short-subunit alcohol dehydrogenase family) n=1 Tax=Nocardiopsis composta TaxID=157465 RepID=A0A7W8QGZ5_9ACTN|nr:SDR family oxidoreductase [Nocardiopsis composta]MBB5430312.1 NAD(P)-dependent dehydrogenase (short-subunit alcohol dehydrogenase family) [Nocardiopsis composta]
MAEGAGAPRTAVVTGAGSGIGRAVALELLDRGYAVALVGRRLERLEETAETSGAGERALPLPADVADPDRVREVFARVGREWGRLDVLFNNAGAMPPPAPVDEVGDDAWRHVVEVNLTGAFWCAREAFRMMRVQDPRGGRIINNGSIAAHAPRPMSVGYTATKHAITGLTKSLALEGRPLGIACGQIDIGNAATELTAGIAAGTLQADGSRAPEPVFDTAHVARAVAEIADLPLEASVPFMTIMATGMPYLGRG